MLGLLNVAGGVADPRGRRVSLTRLITDDDKLVERGLETRRLKLWRFLLIGGREQSLFKACGIRHSDTDQGGKEAVQVAAQLWSIGKQVWFLESDLIDHATNSASGIVVDPKWYAIGIGF